MKLSAPVSSIFLLQPCRAYRHDLDETGLLIPGVGLNQHPLWTSAFRTISKTRHKIPCQKSQVAEPKERRRQSKPVHITGQATVVLTEDNRNRKRSRAPCPVGLNQHVLGPAPGYDVRNGRNDETEPKPRDAGRGRAPRGTRPKAKNFGDEGRAQGIPVGAPLADESGKRNSSPVVDVPSTTMGIQPCDRERQLEPRKTL